MSAARISFLNSTRLVIVSLLLGLTMMVCSIHAAEPPVPARVEFNRDVRPGGMVHGATDDLGYAAVDKIATVHDLHATMLHQLGIESNQFTANFQGLDAKLTGVEGGKAITEILV
jgi:hypothetical protein